MKTTHARSNLAIHMMVQGGVLGTLAGFLVSVSLFMTALSLSPGEILLFMTISAIYGGWIGMMFGGFSGFFSGLAMMLTTALFFREIHNPRLYKYAMGMITFIMAGLVFIMGNFSAIKITDANTWLMVAFLSVLIAVAASQRAANKYLRESDPRKQKASAAV